MNPQYSSSEVLQVALTLVRYVIILTVYAQYTKYSRKIRTLHLQKSKQTTNFTARLQPRPQWVLRLCGFLIIWLFGYRVTTWVLNLLVAVIRYETIRHNMQLLRALEH